MDSFMNEVADFKKEYRDRDKAREGKEILEISGTIASPPETGENSHGRKWCTFEIRTENDVFKLYTVRYYDEAVKLGVGDHVTVRYVHDGKWNNVVGSIVLDDEGRAIDNVLNTVRRIDKKIGFVSDLIVKCLSRIGDIDKKVDALGKAPEDDGVDWESVGKEGE